MAKVELLTRHKPIRLTWKGKLITWPDGTDVTSDQFAEDDRVIFDSKTLKVVRVEKIEAKHGQIRP